MSISIYITGVAVVFFSIALARRTRFLVPEGHYGLLYHRGKYRHRISPGTHHFWTRGYSARLVDMRKLRHAVAGSFVTNDKVDLKINVILTYQIIQAETAIHAVEDYVACLENAVRAALGRVVADAPVEKILNHWFDTGEQLHSFVLPEADRIGIIAHAVEVTDVMMVGDLARARS